MSILGSCLGAPTTAAMEALQGDEIYAGNARYAYIKLRVQSSDPFSQRQSCVATSSGMAFENSTGTLRVQSDHDSIFVTRWQRVGSLNVLDWERSRLWRCKRYDCKKLFEIVGCRSRRYLGRRTKADLATEVLPVARLNSLRAAYGLVVLGGPTCETIDEGGTDG